MEISNNPEDTSSSILEASTGVWASVEPEARKHAAALAKACEDKNFQLMASLIFNKDILSCDILGEFAVERATDLGAEIIPHLLGQAELRRRVLEKGGELQEEEIEGISIVFDVIGNLRPELKEVDDMLFWFLENGEDIKIDLLELDEDAANTLMEIGTSRYTEKLVELCNKKILYAPLVLSAVLRDNAFPILSRLIWEYDFVANPQSFFMISVLSSFEYISNHISIPFLEKLLSSDVVRRTPEFSEVIQYVLNQKMPGIAKAVECCRDAMEQVFSLRSKAGVDSTNTKQLLDALVNDIVPTDEE